MQSVGDPGYASAEGVTALMVRQYKAVCNGVPKRYAVVNVLQSFVDKPHWFKASGALLEKGNLWGIGSFESVHGDAHVYSIPWNVSQMCTRATAKLRWIKDGVEYSKIAYTPTYTGPGC